MDRKTVITFIAVYSLVAGIGFFSRGDNVVEQPVVEEAASYIIEGESVEEVAAAVRAVASPP